MIYIVLYISESLLLPCVFWLQLAAHVLAICCFHNSPQQKAKELPPKVMVIFWIFHDAFDDEHAYKTSTCVYICKYISYVITYVPTSWSAPASDVYQTTIGELGHPTTEFSGAPWHVRRGSEWAQTMEDQMRLAIRSIQIFQSCSAFRDTAAMSQVFQRQHHWHTGFIRRSWILLYFLQLSELRTI